MAITYTRTTRALLSGDQKVYLTSGAGVAANTTLMQIENELLGVVSVNGSVVSTIRGIAGTQAAAHPTNSSVGIGAPADFNRSIPASLGFDGLESLAGIRRLLPVLFATLPAASAGNEGAIAAVADSATVIPGATVTGSGTGHVLAYSNGSAWLVAGATAGSGIPESSLLPASAFALNELRTAHAKYDFAVDGGAATTITLASNSTIPNKAIILGGIINVTTAVTSGGAANVAVGTSAGSAADSLLAATAKASFSLNALLATVPVFTAATAFKMTAAGSITTTIDTNALTAGVFEVFVVYVLAAT